MALPAHFWLANEYNVRGGVENAFMSTTLEPGVAMGYAAGDGSKIGIVIEVQQGMVNRGADISWLSQCDPTICLLSLARPVPSLSPSLCFLCHHPLQTG